MNTKVYRIDKVYGGVYYVEFNTEKNIFHYGNSRSHEGFYQGQTIEIEVTRKKDLMTLENDLRLKGFKFEPYTNRR